MNTIFILCENKRISTVCCSKIYGNHYDRTGNWKDFYKKKLKETKENLNETKLEWFSPIGTLFKISYRHQNRHLSTKINLVLLTFWNWIQRCFTSLSNNDKDNEIYKFKEYKINFNCFESEYLLSVDCDIVQVNKYCFKWMSRQCLGSNFPRA